MKDNTNRLYLVPTVTNGRSIAKRLVMEYRMVFAKQDMRKRFFRDHYGTEVNPVYVIKLVSGMGIKVKDDRLIMKDSNQAREFGEAIAAEEAE